MDPVTAARTAYETAKAEWQAARSAMLAHTKASGQHFHDRAELKAVDALHKAMGRTYTAWWQLSQAAA